MFLLFFSVCILLRVDLPILLPPSSSSPEEASDSEDDEMLKRGVTMSLFAVRFRVVVPGGLPLRGDALHT